jgi:phage tail sheath protein FI
MPPASFLHGVEVLEIQVGPRPVQVVKSAVVGLIGTAPQWAVPSTNSPAAPGKNKLMLVGSPRDASAFGPLIKGYSIPYALQAIFEQGAGLVVVVDVMDPTNGHHSTNLAAQPFTFPASGAQAISLGHMGIDPASFHLNSATDAPDWPGATDAVALGAVIRPTVGNAGGFAYRATTAGSTGGTEPATWGQVASGTTADGGVVWTNIGVDDLTAGVDYTLDAVNGVVTQKAGGAMTENMTVHATFDYADPSKVVDADLVGSVSGNVYTGMQQWLLAYSKLGFFPKILIAPPAGADGPGIQDEGSTSSAVAAALRAAAAKMRGITLLDCAPLTTPAALIAKRGANGDPWNVADARTVLCGPWQTFEDTGILPTGVVLDVNGNSVTKTANVESDMPYSPFVAGAISARDLNQGYWWSPSNFELTGADGPDVDMYSSFLDPNSDQNLLNAAGIVTALTGFAEGVLVWGNRSSLFPTNTEPDNFIPIRRTMDVIEESAELAMLQFMDQPISNALITMIMSSVNAFLRSQIQRGALVGGACTFDPNENPPAELAAGHLTFDIDAMPPPPAERITFQVFIDVTLLRGLGTQVNSAGSAALASA